VGTLGQQAQLQEGGEQSHEEVHEERDGCGLDMSDPSYAAISMTDSTGFSAAAAAAASAAGTELQRSIVVTAEEVELGPASAQSIPPASRLFVTVPTPGLTRLRGSFLRRI
jgi:hypothetical protein